ncbi:glycoside hydrolase family 2 [Niastella vici]|uniref:beta-galactosidase n=1 Tax=Niastella vici TaxID=1703345 RepID=A0A1V9FMG5_9BACT|nr:sugar-binding domain-containing protein [Niastella vici]OQP59545.1 glycoside hydrolase family 2 [Niastella vici]
MNNHKRKLVIFCLLLSGLRSSAQQSISLSGQWLVRLDSLHVGVDQQWYNQQKGTAIKLPGTLDDAAIGNKPTLTTDSLYKDVLLRLTRKHSYIGPAWYSKEIVIPQGFANKQLELYLERVIWKTRVWVDGKEAGSGESLSAPHRFNGSALAKPGKHLLVICIDNSKQYDITHREMAHAYTDGTQIIWNGVIGKLQLIAKDPLFIDHVQTFPDVKDGSVIIAPTLQNNYAQAVNATLQIQVLDKNKKVVITKQETVTVAAGTSKQEIKVALGKAMLLWNEFHPNLYTVNVALTAQNPAVKDIATATFGMREVTNTNGLLQVNGQRIFLRGTLECNIFPLTGHPPMEKNGWLKVFGTAKAYGLNHLRFHSWCPPQAAFDVADSMGFYLQIELPLWSMNTGMDKNTNGFLEAEAAQIIKEYGNHPSFVLWSLGNELQGDFQWLAGLLKQLKATDKRHLYTTTTFTFQKGHGTWPEADDDYFITQYTRKGWVRGQGIFNKYAPNFSTDYTKSIDSLTVPLITHEIGQYSVYPNLKEIKKYTGVLDPLNFKAIEKDLSRKGLLALAPSYTLASGKFSANLYKEEIERALKTKGLSGFELLDLHDFPGQGTALVGILDAFWDSKGLVTPEQHRQYCGPVVPLLRFEKATYTNNESLEATAEAANFSSSELKGVVPVWTVTDSKGKKWFSGRLTAKDLPVGNDNKLGSIRIELGSITEAAQLTLELKLEGTTYKNNWTFWVYPAQLKETNNKVAFTTSVKEAVQWLNEGRNVLLNPDTTALKGEEGRFAPVFWSPVHFPNQPGTMGILCEPQHPALQKFPTDFYSNWQWWDLITSSKTMVLDSLPKLTPIVTVIDNFFKNRRMANVIEVKAGKGKLIISSLDLSHDLDKRPAARQLRYSLEQYMGSNAFNPAVELKYDQLGFLIK